MRIGNLDGRLVILTGAGALDVQRASEGRFGADPQAVYHRWAEFRSWAAAQATEAAERHGSALRPRRRANRSGSVLITATMRPSQASPYVEGIGELRQRFVAGPDS